MQQYQPKAYLTNSVLSNPVSLSIHPARAFAVLQLLHVLAQQVGVKGVFSDWPATTTFYANCLLPTAAD